MPYDRVERAALAFVSEFDALDVVGRCRRSSRATAITSLGRHIDEFRACGSMKRLIEPGAGDAVDLRTLARHPSLLEVACRLRRVGKPCVCPGRNAAFKVSRLASRRCARRAADALADLVAVHAIGHDRAVGRQVACAIARSSFGDRAARRRQSADRRRRKPAARRTSTTIGAERGAETRVKF